MLLQAHWGDATYRMTLLLPPREALLRSWADTDSLFGCIANWGAQPIVLRHPFSFYYGHCAAFTKLKFMTQVGLHPSPQRSACRLGCTNLVEWAHHVDINGL